MREGGMNGNTLYDSACSRANGTYDAEPAHRLSWRAGWAQWQRVRLHRRHHLPQRVARHQPRPESLGSALWEAQQ